MNFNLNLQNNEYNLQNSLTDEVIRIYGIPVRLVIAEKMNKDFTFGDFSHLKTSDYHELYMLAENTEEFEQGELLSSQFGIIPESNINFFVSRNQVENLFKDLSKILGSLLVLPSLKVLEITDIQLEVPGINNLFTQANVKNCYKLKCRSYSFKGTNELSYNILEPSEQAKETNKDLQNEFKTLENYFEELNNIKEEQEQTVKNIVKKDDVFGRF